MPDDLLVTVKAALKHGNLIDRGGMVLYAEVRALLDRCTAAEASYQEAQLTIAGLEAERDHYRDQARHLRERLCVYDRSAYTSNKEAK